MYKLLVLILPMALWGQSKMDYKVTSENPFGKLNPEAAPQTADYEDLIGICDCKSVTRNPDQSWADPQDMTWTFKYIMNGMAVQDETLKEDGSHSGSIRQFIADSSKWYVHYYSNRTPTARLSTWEGGKLGDSIVLYNPQKAPNGMDGFYRITFKDINEKGFNWLGEWVDTTESFIFPTWRISCIKRPSGADETIIRRHIKAFSEAYMAKDHLAIANFYTTDGKIFPTNAPIIEGRAAIAQRWKISEESTNLYHKVTPIEIKIVGDTAYDHGLYEGSITNAKGVVTDFSGKYVIVWKKVEGDWKIYLDIWNKL